MFARFLVHITSDRANGRGGGSAVVRDAQVDGGLGGVVGCGGDDPRRHGHGQGDEPDEEVDERQAPGVAAG